MAGHLEGSGAWDKDRLGAGVPTHGDQPVLHGGDDAAAGDAADLSDSTTTRSPTSTIVDLLWMVTKPGHPSVPKTAGFLQDGMRWRSLWATVDGALVERMGLSMVRQLGLQVVWPWR